MTTDVRQAIDGVLRYISLAAPIVADTPAEPILSRAEALASHAINGLSGVQIGPAATGAAASDFAALSRDDIADAIQTLKLIREHQARVQSCNDARTPVPLEVETALWTAEAKLKAFLFTNADALLHGYRRAG